MTVVHDGPHLQSEYRIRTEELSTLQSLAAEVQRQQETKADYVVDTRRMSFATVSEENTDEGNADAVGSWLTFDGEGHDSVDGGIVREHAHRQIRERLGIPAKYYERLRAEAPTLLDANVGHWLREKPEQRMVRMLDGKVRAFLSNRYNRLDNLDLLERAVLPELSRYENDLVFHVSAMTDERLYIRCLLPKVQAEVKVGDIVQAGVQIRNSEVGDGRLSVSSFVWRLRCLNGMVGQDVFSRFHVGRSQDEGQLERIMRDDTRRAEDEAFWMKVRDAVAYALDETYFGEIVDTLREAATGLQVADIPVATERLAKSYDLTEGEQGSILTHLAAGGDLSKWGLANATTAAAKKADSFARQAELESLGWEIASLPAAEWATIAR